MGVLIEHLEQDFEMWHLRSPLIFIVGSDFYMLLFISIISI